MPVATEFIEATTPQKSFLTNLLNEKQTEPAYRVDTLFLIEVGELSKDDASKEIGYLLKQPSLPKKSMPMATEPGYYYDESSETVYQIVKAKTTSNLYAKKMVPAPPGKKKGSWEYAPGAMKQSASWQMLDLEEAAALGKKWEICCICGATLTDPKSMDAGIGPICAKKF